MRNRVSYEQIHPLVQYVEIASDMVQCHFHCPVKSKKIVAITRLSKFSEFEEREPINSLARLKSSSLFRFKRYFTRYEVREEESVDYEQQKENAILHAFGKISERFVWSDEHKHFVYRF